MRVGGIAGEIQANGNKEYFSVIDNCYNSGNIESKGICTGGIGNNDHYCYVKNSYVSSSTTVKYNGATASANIGSSGNYLGRVLGHNNGGNDHISNIGVLSSMPTVYKVVNGLNDGESQYWSKSDINKPRLLWEK